MPKLRVLLLSHQLSLSGAPKIVLDLFEDLKDKIDLRIVSMESGAIHERFEKLGALTLIPDVMPAGNRLQRLRRRSAPQRLAASLRHWQPDLIYCNTVAALPIPKMLQLPEVPVLLHVHELGLTVDAFAQDHRKFLCHWPDRYVVVSEPVRQLLIERYQISPQKIALVHAFVPDQRFGEQNVVRDARRATENDEFVVGGAGWPSWRKGVTLWLQMASELVALMGRDKVRFVWVGAVDNEFCRQLHIEAAQLNIQDRVEFVQETEDVLPHFQRFDVLAMTSWEDPCPIVVLECMLLKKPVLCFSGSGGAPEEVGETGVVVEGFSPTRMAAAVSDLAGSPETRRILGEAASQRVREHFVASVQVPKIFAQIMATADCRRGDVRSDTA